MFFNKKINNNYMVFNIILLIKMRKKIIKKVKKIMNNKKIKKINNNKMIKKINNNKKIKKIKNNKKIKKNNQTK
jgi:hypothetical protein